MLARPSSFSLTARDGVDKISEGTHDRCVIDAAKFNAKVAARLAGFCGGKGSRSEYPGSPWLDKGGRSWPVLWVTSWW